MTAFGFTGTQRDMSERQKRALSVLLRGAGGFTHTFHHGDDQGADLSAHFIAQERRCFIEVHPPENMRRAAGLDGNKRWDPLPYLDRNRVIVDCCDVLVAAPYSLVEQQRSGTWATIRYARRLGRPVVILDP